MLKTLYFGLSVLTGGDVFAEGIQQPESDAVEQRSEVLPTVTGSQPSQILEAANPRPVKSDAATTVLPKDIEAVNRLISGTSWLVVALALYDVGHLFYHGVLWLFEGFGGEISRQVALYNELKTKFDATRDRYRTYTPTRAPRNADLDIRAAHQGQRLAYVEQINKELNVINSEIDTVVSKIKEAYAKRNTRLGIVLNQGVCILFTVFRHPVLRLAAVASHMYTFCDQSWFRASLNSIHLTATVYRDLRLWWHKRHNRGVSDAHKVDS
jgi:hypothetical protein